jgi:hypothetical protein
MEHSSRLHSLLRLLPVGVVARSARVAHAMIVRRWHTKFRLSLVIRIQPLAHNTRKGAGAVPPVYTSSA